MFVFRAQPQEFLMADNTQPVDIDFVMMRQIAGPEFTAKP
jgi:regulator of protease activity HflC (stomatin/prohibitin superfamily)